MSEFETVSNDVKIVTMVSIFHLSCKIWRLEVVVSKVKALGSKSTFLFKVVRGNAQSKEAIFGEYNMP